jgi:hypothetical protein
MADRMLIVDRGRIVSEVMRDQLSVRELTEHFLELQRSGEEAIA